MWTDAANVVYRLLRAPVSAHLHVTRRGQQPVRMDGFVYVFYLTYVQLPFLFFPHVISQFGFMKFLEASDWFCEASIKLSTGFFKIS
jgi:hypothetical protein